MEKLYSLLLSSPSSEAGVKIIKKNTEKIYLTTVGGSWSNTDLLYFCVNKMQRFFMIELLSNIRP